MLALLMVAGTVVPNPGEVGRAAAQTPAQPRPRPMVVPFEGRGKVYGGEYLPSPAGTDGRPVQGVVTAVDATTITVADEGTVIELFELLPGGGQRLDQRLVYPPVPAKRFTAVGPLAEGKHLPAGHEGTLYCLSDVAVGDRVSFHARRYDGVDEVHYIAITRRPGGRVPPCPDGDSRVRGPYHERMNALQAWEERGQPIPDKYHPGGNQAGVAPMPRPAKP